jgi:uncharacterized protein (DUF433 family)
MKTRRVQLARMWDLGENGCMATQIAPGITVDPKVRFGKPVIEGTRVDVETVLRALAAGWKIEDVIREFGLTKDALYAVLSFAADLVANGTSSLKQSV